MQLIDSQPVSFLYCREETRIDDLERFIPMGQKLIEEAVNLNLGVAGPVHWHYHNFTPFPGRSFFLEVCVPVVTIPKEYDGIFQIKRTEGFLSVCELHIGSWYDLPLTYQKLMHYVEANQLRTTGQNRELYINVDFLNPLANLTLVQIGVVK